MRLSAAALLLTVLISSFSPGHGSNVTDINQCPTWDTHQALVQRKNKSVVCLNPAANWVQKLITVLQKRNLLSTAPAPVMKRAA
ncbi:C-X-C motif chemokine 13 [Heterocephalus glaber]|uniref:C-X-C motif chemokine 13 n=1 Tax=Heterocephalus glaber TaxID=10181 RepID=G5C1J4_HETGA|nr:C-X-C motif chemokine 13 [Heterocephalus glaber]